ncbi:hypothetical protein T439DRAFT_357834 [Meredithblackwellia eburnea MCA 4105]
MDKVETELEVGKDPVNKQELDAQTSTSLEPDTTNESPPPGSGTSTPTWTKHYDTLKTKLPTQLSSRLPSSAVAASTVGDLSTRLSSLTTSSAAQLTDLQRSGSKRLGKVRDGGKEWSEGVRKKIGEGSNVVWGKNAWSVTNETQVVINVSLNQVGPLMYAVVAPNETFERRVPNVWYNLELRPYTSLTSAYNSWSVTWPIMAIAGPVAAATSLLLIPVVALAAGGTALASLTGFGAAVAEGAATAAAGAGSAAASVGGVVAKLSHVPGVGKVRGKLVEAAKGNLEKGKEKVTEGVVRYFAKGAMVGGTAAEIEERGRKKERVKKKEMLAEVEVTGLELSKVLKCETGKRRTDKALKDAFKKLDCKIKEFKTKDNPVLRIVGGPELEDRGKHQFLVFYPLHCEPIENVEVEPIPPTELPPTESEESLMRDTMVVESVKEAEEVAKKAPTWEEGKREQVEAVVKDVEEHDPKGKGKDDGEAKTAGSGSGSGWFGWGAKK